MSNTKVELYHRKQCPYCKKVQAVLQEMDLEMIQKDVGKNADDLEELRAVGGKTQVPCLIQVNDQGEKTALYESDDIISWIKTHENELR